MESGRNSGIAGIFPHRYISSTVNSVSYDFDGLSSKVFGSKNYFPMADKLGLTQEFMVNEGTRR